MDNAGQLVLQTTHLARADNFYHVVDYQHNGEEERSVTPHTQLGFLRPLPRQTQSSGKQPGNNLSELIMGHLLTQPQRSALARKEPAGHLQHPKVAFVVLAVHELGRFRAKGDADRKRAHLLSLRQSFRQHLLDGGYADVWAVELERPGVVAGFDGLLEQEQGLHDAGLAGAVDPREY